MSAAHYGLPPCHLDRTAEVWHVSCALRHPVVFLRAGARVGGLGFLW